MTPSAVEIWREPAASAAAKTALESGQIDAIVSDLPTALYITAVEIWREPAASAAARYRLWMSAAIVLWSPHA